MSYVHTDDELGTIGMKHGLKYTQLRIFIEYLKARGFHASEKEYIHEWAQRFAEGRAYSKSDGFGQSLLDDIVPEIIGDNAEYHECWKPSQSN